MSDSLLKEARIERAGGADGLHLQQNGEAPLYMRPPKDVTRSSVLYIAGVGSALGSTLDAVHGLLDGLGLDEGGGDPAIQMVPSRVR